MNAPLSTLREERAPQCISGDPNSYIFTRVVDALLREDVRECVSKAIVVAAGELPDSVDRYRSVAAFWLRVAQTGASALWIPVKPATFMQTWRFAGPFLLWQSGQRLDVIDTVGETISRFANGLPPTEAALFDAFAVECNTAAGHRELSEQERARWFSALDAAGDRHPPDTWHERLMHYDRLAAFLDHPLYPTARAKLGFDDAALAAYGPEHQRPFLLRWLAVPREHYHPSIENEQDWPAFWPDFAAVGLPNELAATHSLVPIHPFVWEHHLEGFLIAADLHQRVQRAPLAYLPVVPTLSVRSLVVLDAPAWHVKLPLTIRTLGAKNIRTIKPSTIADGHLIQTVLGAIAADEPTIVDRLLLTDEQRGGHVNRQSFLGYILRRYPAGLLEDSTVLPVASLLAETPAGKTVIEEAAVNFFGGDCGALFADYLELTLTLHLRLWVRYGIALESNQQNSMVVFRRGEPRLRLLLKDNDAARIHTTALASRRPDLAQRIDQLEDRRIMVDDPLALAQMFTTITLQLNIAVLIEGLAGIVGRPAATFYADVRERIDCILADLESEDDDVALARRVLLEEDHLYLKHLLVAATLADKSATGAADVNKFYGRSAPNFLRVP